MAFRRIGEGISDDLSHRLVEPDSLVLKQRFGFVMELTNVFSRRLRELSAGEDVAEVFEAVLSACPSREDNLIANCRTITRMFGSHLSISGGMHLAILEAERLDMDTVQVFTKNQQQWECKPLDAEACDCWAKERDRLKFKKTVSHASYLINLASPDDVLWEKSIDLFGEELRRCAILEIPYLVVHPGAHMGRGEAAGLKRIAAAIDRAVRQAPADGVVICLEITAGQGTSLGCKLEHLAEIISLVNEPKRMGVCLDTAHLFAAGYDFRGKKYAAFRKEISGTVGLGRVKVLHLNDSKKELGSHVDRHEHIGRGMIGLEGFTPFVRDEAFAKVPKILETAKGKDAEGREWDAVNLEVLRGLIG